MVAIETRYLGPTNTKGSRIVVTAGSGNRVIANCNSAISNEENHRRAADLLRRRLHWSGAMVGGSTKAGMAWVFVDNPKDTI